MRRGCAKNNTFCWCRARVPDRGNKAAPATTFSGAQGSTLHPPPLFEPRRVDRVADDALQPGCVLKGLFWFTFSNTDTNEKKKFGMLEVGK